MSTHLSSNQLLLQQNFLVACRDGNRQVLEACLDDPTDRYIVNVPAPLDDVRFSGKAALHVACAHNQYELLLVLLQEYRADPNAVDSNGTTPLISLVRLGTLQDGDGRKANMVQLLMQYEAEPNVVDSSGQNALHVACQIGCLRHLQRLVAFGGRVEKVDHQGWTPLALACSKGHFVVVHWLLSSAQVDPNKSGRGSQSPLAVACHAKNVNIMAVLLQYGAELPTVAVVDNGKEILAREVNDKGQTVLHCLCAAKSPNVDVIQNLLSFCGAKININATDYQLRSAFHLAAQTNSLQAVRRLLQEPLLVLGSPDIEGNTPLALTQSADLALALLLDERLRKQPSSEVHRPDHKGITPLQRASKEERHDLLCVLLENGANPNVNPCPLFHPAQRGDVGMVDQLLAHGADPNGMTPRQKPLLAACRNGHYAVVLRLVGVGADANAVDPATGATALHLACQGGHVDIVEHLVHEGGARLDVRDRGGRTPLDVAEQFRRKEATKNNAAKQVSVVPELPSQEVSSWGRRKFLAGISHWKEQTNKQLPGTVGVVDYY